MRFPITGLHQLAVVGPESHFGVVTAVNDAGTIVVRLDSGGERIVAADSSDVARWVFDIGEPARFGDDTGHVSKADVVDGLIHYSMEVSLGPDGFRDMVTRPESRVRPDPAGKPSSWTRISSLHGFVPMRAADSVDLDPETQATLRYRQGHQFLALHHLEAWVSSPPAHDEEEALVAARQSILAARLGRVTLAKSRAEAAEARGRVRLSGSRLATVLDGVAEMNNFIGDHVRAAELLSEVVTIYEREPVRGRDLELAYGNLGATYAWQKKHAAAEPLLRKAIALGQARDAEGRPDVKVYARQLELLYRETGDREAEMAARRIWRVSPNKAPSAAPETAEPPPA